MKIIFNWLGVAALAFLAAPAAGAAGLGADPMPERAEAVMGTLARVALPAPLARPAAFEAAFTVLRAVDGRMSLYRPAAELVRLNRRASVHAVPVSAELFAVLARARELSVQTDGAFDVTVLPLLRAWGGYRGLTHLGPPGAFAVGYAGLVLDPGTRTVRFRSAGMGVDLGGVAKGFALDRAALTLAGMGVRRARLDLGGTVLFLGAGPGGEWRVVVRDPEAPERPLGILGLGPGSAVATSGNYHRDLAAEGWRTASHVYDPRSWRPVGRELAVTVWASDATTADALATAFLVLGPVDASAVVGRQPGVGALFVEGTGAARRIAIVGHPPRTWTRVGAQEATLVATSPQAQEAAIAAAVGEERGGAPRCR